MTKYEIIFEELQNRVNNGLLTVEEAEVVNDLAYDKYVTESFVYEIQELKNKKRDLIERRNQLQRGDKRRDILNNQIEKISDDIDKAIKFWGGTTRSGPGELKSDHIYKTKKSVGSTFQDQVGGYEVKRK